MSVITARYAGECFSCGTHIERGERVRWTRGEGIRHAQSRDCEDPEGTSCCGDYHYADCPIRSGGVSDFRDDYDTENR
jgi:hypothetical protein